MAKCAVCEKGAYFGNNVSHSHRRSNKCGNLTKSVRVKNRYWRCTEDVCMYFLVPRSGKVERA